MLECYEITTPKGSMEFHEKVSDRKVVRRSLPTSPQISPYFSPYRTTFSFGVTAKNAAAQSATIATIIIIENRKIRGILRALVPRPSVNRELRTLTMSCDGPPFQLPGLTLSGPSTLYVASL